jgi:2-hydroxychromene-2-carboxylate isomerase
VAPVQFWFEFASTYSYVAALRIEAVAGSRGVPFEWKPFLLGPIFRRQGWNDSPFNLYPARGRYMWRDVERLCGKHGLPFRKPTVFPRNSVLAARVACAGSGQGWLPGFVRGVYRANFADDRDISDATVLEEILGTIGQQGARVIELAISAENKERLRRETETAWDLGIFGAPTCVVGGELFWGNDRMDDALDWYTAKGGGGACPNT